MQERDFGQGISLLNRRHRPFVPFIRSPPAPLSRYQDWLLGDTDLDEWERKVVSP